MKLYGNVLFGFRHLKPQNQQVLEAKMNKVALSPGFSPVREAVQSYKGTKLSMSVEIFAETCCLEQESWPAQAWVYDFGFI